VNADLNLDSLDGSFMLSAVLMWPGLLSELEFSRSPSIRKSLYGFGYYSVRITP
jgi:hypothetical protein